MKPVLDGTGLTWNVLFVDDGSRDGSFEVLRETHHEDPRIRAVLLKENRGQQNAVYCGICHARGELIITMDDDLQHPPLLIPRLIEEISAGRDLVYAVVRDRSRPAALRMGTWLNGGFFSLFLAKPLGLEIGSYRIFTSSLARKIAGEKGRFVYVSALFFRLKPRPEAASFRYSATDGAPGRKSRFSLHGRFRLFFRLFFHYGPLSLLAKRDCEPYIIGEEL